MDPRVRLSRERAGQLLDPEFVEVGGSGRRWTYEAMLVELPDHPGSPLDAPRFEPSDISGVLLAPGLVHLTFETMLGERRTRHSSIWRRGTEPRAGGCTTTRPRVCRPAWTGRSRELVRSRGSAEGRCPGCGEAWQAGRLPVWRAVPLGVWAVAGRGEFQRVAFGGHFRMPELLPPPNRFTEPEDPASGGGGGVSPRRRAVPRPVPVRAAGRRPVGKWESSRSSRCPGAWSASWQRGQVHCSRCSLLVRAVARRSAEQ